MGGLPPSQYQSNSSGCPAEETLWHSAVWGKRQDLSMGDGGAEPFPASSQDETVKRREV